MMKRLPRVPPHSDSDTSALLEALLQKLEYEELIFLLRMFQRDLRAKHLLARKIKKVINLKLS
ncbi:hypothetical protein ACU6T4_11695 [Avibacterium paragallinarum]|uniref:hypothetical protein n=1 Tax=Avibacterium paragallinarum TaxID=728 RepID=UPI00021ACFDB|nr:hypothetical protein [Avibacterium paragallinarum]AZI14126.1 hypothetical protein EIA51_05530 [Avibacterium paragallinarum]QIR11596.1 hypothetical protein HBL79_04680 [Avibacterium paragallinarum]QJE09430.1 hypothetical protein HHJ62_03470 [Avibacterium paragallinarum]QJE11626.1 hypothetical protein HHJ61_03470 [Avibacterium paragallinarum]QJE13825.1 hypothetical protein HHJ60_03480 [Avibacterium paragallinarum]